MLLQFFFNTTDGYGTHLLSQSGEQTCVICTKLFHAVLQKMFSVGNSE